MEFIKNFLRNFKFFNKIENNFIADELEEKIFEIKKKNSEIVFNAYYIPKAISAILKEDGYLTTERGAIQRATAMMNADIANGVLTEFYRFK